jgi:hypothetical protein
MANERESMKPIGVLLIHAIAVLKTVSQQSRTTAAVPQPEDRIVDTFESHGDIALHSFLRFAAESKVPLGLVLVDDQLCKKKTEISIRGESVQTVIGKLTSQVDGYQWVLQDGVLLVEPQLIPESTSQLLNMPLTRFAAPRTTLKGLGLFLTVDVRAQLRPDPGGTAGSLSRSPDTPMVGPLELRNLIVQQILNMIAKLVRGGEWILYPTPDDYRKAADRKFVEVIDYSENPLGNIQALRCVP